VNATDTLVEVLRSEGVRVLATLARTVTERTPTIPPRQSPMRRHRSPVTEDAC